MDVSASAVPSDPCSSSAAACSISSTARWAGRSRPAIRRPTRRPLPCPRSRFLRIPPERLDTSADGGPGRLGIAFPRRSSSAATASSSSDRRRARDVDCGPAVALIARTRRPSRRRARAHKDGQADSDRIAMRSRTSADTASYLAAAGSGSVRPRDGVNTGTPSRLGTLTLTADRKAGDPGPTRDFVYSARARTALPPWMGRSDASRHLTPSADARLPRRARTSPLLASPAELETSLTDRTAAPGSISLTMS